jgi:hypothetical protein
MSTQSIQIKKNPTPTPSQPAVFAPKTVVANAGDNLTWHNADGHPHWPAPSAANPSGWLQYQIPSGGNSRGDVALAANTLNVTAATNANPVVLTLNGPAPPTGTVVTMASTAPDESDWSKVNGPFPATKLGPNTCSIPVDSSAFGALTPAVGALTLTIPLPYTLNYVCALHPDETGTITVNPQP